jgi:glycosyltransferase involved in cell wall biosynthesis
LTGLPWSCSAHAKDIWTTPDRELAGKLEDAAFTVTCTQAGLQRLNSLAPPQKSAKLVYHGLDLIRFKALTVPNSERTGADIAKPVRFLTVARAVDKKGLDTLIDALALLPPELNWRWTYIGGGTLVQSLTVQSRSRGIGENCHFMGAKAQEDVIAAYASNDIFVLPCRIAGDGDRDGLPNVLMEAGSQGLTLVSTPISGVTELIEDGVTGCIVKPDDPKQLAEMMEKLMRNPTLRYKLGRAAAHRISQRFDHSKTMGGLTALFPHSLRDETRSPQE